MRNWVRKLRQRNETCGKQKEQHAGENTNDPICGMEVGENPRLKSSYKGREYGFCSQPCKQSFDKKPDKYAR